jgi:hypothetical protein
MQLVLPVAVGEPIQKVYVQMDGTGLPGSERNQSAELMLARSAPQPAAIPVTRRKDQQHCEPLTAGDHANRMPQCQLQI